MPSEPPSRTLVSTAEVAARLGDSRLVIADVRWYLGRPGDGRRAYDAGHVPGAIHLDLDADLAHREGFGAPGRHPLPSPDAFAARMAAAGVADDTFVVAYDDAGGWIAARLWWMLDNLGHNRPGRGGVAVLDGGWQAWRAEDRSTSTDIRAPQPAPADLHLDDRWARVIARDELRSRLGSLVLLDARAVPRYRGEVEPIDPVAGHIPTAVSAPWDGDVGPDGRLLPPEALRRHLTELGIGGSADVVTSCGSGTSATLHILAARVADLADPILYVGSYSDWSRSGYPVATGPEPGEPGTPP